MAGYINIHTHHLSKEDGVFLFNNRFNFENDLFLGKYFSIGIHPWDAELKVDFENFEKLVTHENCLAVGECGLDKLKGPDLEIQKVILEAQLQLAAKFKKPVIIHCVKAFDELIEICRPFKEVPKIIHGFNKSPQLAKQLIDAGFYLSLNESVLKKENFDFSLIPIDKLFLETDMNKLILIQEIYNLALERFKVELEILKAKINLNFTTIFLKNGR
ncbi:MAG: TatD family hydrolase [Burkholderiales bacterium]|nr:TatD family hydrolase [Bacteroidia bacterium]